MKLNFREIEKTQKVKDLKVLEVIDELPESEFRFNYKLTQNKSAEEILGELL